MPEIEFFYDFASPYSYLAATRIEAVAERVGATTVWRPFGLGFLFKAVGNKPPASLAPKGAYMMQDLVHWSEYYNEPFKMPSIFPMNTIMALRSALAIENQAGLREFSLAVFRAYWSQDKDINQAEVLSAIADNAGLDGQAIIAATSDQQVKDRLRDNTDEAVARGAFGAPTFYVGDAMFWGNDRLVMLEYHLKKK